MKFMHLYHIMNCVNWKCSFQNISCRDMYGNRLKIIDALMFAGLENLEKL